MARSPTASVDGPDGREVATPVVAAKMELQRGEPLLHVLLGGRESFLQCIAGQPAIAGDGGVEGTAEQLVDRLVERLAREVPQRNVNRGQRFEHKPGAVPAQPHRGVQMVPEHLDGQWVLPQQQRREEVRNDGLGDAGDRWRVGLAPPDETGIRGQPHQQRLLLCRVGAEMTPLIAVERPDPAGHGMPVTCQDSRRSQPHFRHVVAVGDDVERLHVGNLHPHILPRPPP